MTNQIQDICCNIGRMILECSELLNKVVIANESLNEKQKQAARTTYISLVNCSYVVNNLNVYDQQEAEKEDGKDE